jgi:glucans biosynthesis protein C
LWPWCCRRRRSCFPRECTAYESVLCVALGVGLLTLFRETVRGQGRWSRELAAGSYAVYVLHLPLVVSLQYCLSGRGLTAVAAWGVVSVLAVPASFLLAAGLRRLPGLRGVL